jgi:hypothetical protein
VLLLLDFDDGAILERPLDNIGLVRCALDPVTLLESGPELAEVLKLDQVPDTAEGRLDDGRLADGGGGRDTGRHYDLVICNWFVIVGLWCCTLVTSGKTRLKSGVNGLLKFWWG